MHSQKTTRHYRSAGFTLVEMLVVILIIAVLAAFSFTALTRMRYSAAKATSINQMRNIHVAIHAYMADKSWSEPFHAATSTADFPHENSLGTNPGKYVVGNPARALYNHSSPDTGYLQNPSEFFSPLVKNKVPAFGEYNPSVANSSRIWGTYAWFHPWSLNVRGLSKVNPKIDGRFLMATWYEPTEGQRFKEKIYHALMIDGSVITAGQSQEAFDVWFGLK